MLTVGENAGRHIADFSSTFQSEFVTLLSRRFGTKRVKANTVYQEFIQDKNHLHMNSTRWVTLTEFVKYLGRCGIARVDETEKGWFIAWIDNSPKALAKQEASMKKERMTTSDEQRERMLLAEQIERAATTTTGEASGSGSSSSQSPPPVEEGFKRDEGSEKVVLSLSLAPKASTSTTTTMPSISSGLKLNPLKSSNPLKLAANPLKASNPLKRPNVFKQASSTAPSGEAGKKRDREDMGVAEKLMVEDQERKRRRMEREGA